jgi:hypothetical protein
MDGCFRCHEAEKHECTTCHPAGTLRTPENGPSIEANSCAVCHLDWETRTHDAKGARFRHGPHLAGELLCEQCHSHEEGHGQLALSEGNCSQECHQIQPASHKNGWLKRHGPDFEAGARDCAGCHETEFCRRCHGVEMPHPQDWRGRHGRPALLDGQSCVRCHQSEFCADCHRTAKPATHVADWVRKHGQKQLTECAQCHAQSFCSGCHDRARPASHTGDWVEEHPAAAGPAAEMCATCHRRDFCTSCHGGIDLPHPSDWMLEHRGQASFARGSVCYRCHEYSETCALCHGEQPADRQ